MKLTHALLNCSVAASVLSLAPCPAPGQPDYPAKPIRIVVGVAPGGATDILARVIGTKMSESLRQQVFALTDNSRGTVQKFDAEKSAVA